MEWQDEDCVIRPSERGAEQSSHEGYHPGYAPSYAPSYGQQSSGYDQPPKQQWNYGDHGQEHNYGEQQSHHYAPPSAPPSNRDDGDYPGHRFHSEHQQGYGQGYEQPHYAPPGGHPPRPPSQQQNYGPQVEVEGQGPVQHYFQYSQCNGRKKGLFIGINYFGQSGQLGGCVNDVENITEFLISRFGYRKEDMVILTDDQDDARRRPTKDNMLRAMEWLVADAAPNDSLFFHYSGHGGQNRDKDGDEEDGYDEVIYPVDYEEAGHILDDEMHKIMVNPLPAGCRLTAIFDSCHSGSVLDLPYMYSTEGKIKEPNLYAEAGEDLLSGISAYARGDNQGLMQSAIGLFKTFSGNANEAHEYTKKTRTSPADVISWSGCKDSQTSADTQEGGEATGAMSHAFVTALNDNPEQSYQQLLVTIRGILKSKYSQKPQLSCSHPMDVDLRFIC